MRRVLLKDVPRPPHLDFQDQHDEARRFGAGVNFQWLLRARLPRQKDLLRRKAPSCQPRTAEANFELSDCGWGGGRALYGGRLNKSVLGSHVAPS